MNKKLLISIIVIIAIVAGIFAAKYLIKGQISSEETAIEKELSVKEDSTASINQMLEETEELDLGKEFQGLDAELQNL